MSPSSNKKENVEENDSTFTPRKISLFGAYSKVFKVMLASWKDSVEHADEELRSKELDELILPSNEEWRHQVYYRLVDLQREFDAEAVERDNSKINIKLDDTKILSLEDEIPWEWEPIANDRGVEGEIVDEKVDKNIFVPSMHTESSKNSITESYVEPGWRLDDIILAAKVLQGETLPLKTDYADEAEMRRVFGLVYDVLRYKQILNQTLNDAGFWNRYPQLRDRERNVWLLLYDMLGKKFTNPVHVSVTEIRRKMFQAAALFDIEEALIKMKTKLAASVSRLRIGGAAFTLDNLLPVHLRNEGINWTYEQAIATGWVNTIKIPKKSDFIEEMSKLGLEISFNWKKLQENNYAFDPVCPKIILLHEKLREQLAKSELVQKHKFVFLERSLCLGAAALTKAIRVGHLCGPVVLTHTIAPRHIGYLAGLLIDIEEAGRLLAFGAESRKQEYEAYLKDLGITDKQCKIFSESYIQAPRFEELERATVVLATPPCSYTGLRNIVDLIVARGGDTVLLESLTNLDDRSQLERPRELLAGQMTCLKYALTRPNVQLLIYEAHSTLPSETVEMLHQVVEYANKMAVDKYNRENMPKKKSPGKETSPKSGRGSSRAGKRSGLESRVKSSGDEHGDNEEEITNVNQVSVPDSDLFEIESIFDLDSKVSDDIEDSKDVKNIKKQKKTTDAMIEDGCYLGVVRRKEMMQFNSLFMIKVAESKGLFGDLNAKPNEPKPQMKEESTPSKNELSIEKKKKKKKKSIQLDRISAPTHASTLKVENRAASRQSVDNNYTEESLTPHVKLSCPKYSSRVARDEKSSDIQVQETRRQDLRKWWEQSASFLIHAAKCETCKFRIFHTDPWTKKVLYATKIQKIIFPESYQH
ncbi:uncharacterized protein [Chelonus insularis]|uniref:uncharacterized protein n=1 Tax=Chelonus insularis TaxID=460826 RepID=UPI0015883B61|nr:uncharacterized protein LOC118075007 [Chelonus insularis]